MKIARGAFLQRGRGISNWVAKGLGALKSLFTSVASSPVTKRVASEVGKSAANAGLQMVEDTLGGHNVGQSLKKNLKSVGERSRESLIRELNYYKRNFNGGYHSFQNEESSTDDTDIDESNLGWEPNEPARYDPPSPVKRKRNVSTKRLSKKQRRRRRDIFD